MRHHLAVTVVGHLRNETSTAARDCHRRESESAHHHRGPFGTSEMLLHPENLKYRAFGEARGTARPRLARLTQQMRLRLSAIRHSEEAALVEVVVGATPTFEAVVVDDGIWTTAISFAAIALRNLHAGHLESLLARFVSPSDVTTDGSSVERMTGVRHGRNVIARLIAREGSHHRLGSRRETPMTLWRAQRRNHRHWQRHM